MKKLFIFVIAPLILITAACTNTDQKHSGANAASEQKAIGDSFGRMANSQPPPSFDWSQVRQTLIDVESAQATGAASTTAFYLEGVGLIEWCPSIGSPVASTTQLSSTKQWVDLPGDHTNDLREVDQGEPTGVYPGPSTGTWTLCLDNNGKKYGVYWEGYVHSTLGVVNSYPADKRNHVDSVTYNFTEGPRK